MTVAELRRYGAGLVVCLALWVLDRDALDLAAVAAIALIGTPHGAADILRMRALAPGLPRLTLLASAYLAIAAAVWWLFARWPAPCLLGFVALSLYHFVATDRAAESGAASAATTADATPRRAAPDAAWAASFVAIFAPFVLWQDTVQAYLRWLGLTAAQAAAVAPVPAACVVAVAVLLSLAAARVRAHSRRSPSTAAWIAAPSLLLPPAAAFALYFCALHAPRHWAQLRRELPRMRSAPVLAVTLATLGIAAMLLRPHAATDLAPRLVQVVVIGLAALTVPHMLLDGWLRRTRGRQRDAL